MTSRAPLVAAAVAVAMGLAAPATASAGILDSFTNAVTGSQAPVPQGRGTLNRWQDGNPCYASAENGRQAGDDYDSFRANTIWRTIGSAPTILPPGVFWQLGDQQGFIPADGTDQPSIPPTITSVPAGARQVTTTRWQVAPTSGLVPYQPATTIACSNLYDVKFKGPYSSFGSQGAVPVVDCARASKTTPYIQWIQDLGKDTPGIVDGFSTNQALISALQEAGYAGATKGVQTTVMNTLKALWGAKSSDVFGSVAGSLLAPLANGYLKSVADQSAPIGNAVWDYYADRGVSWMSWAPVRSTRTGSKLEINVVTPNPATDRVAISVACSSTPTVQGSVIDLRENVDLTQLQPAYYGTPTGAAKPRAAVRQATDAEPTATADDDGGAQPTAASDTVVGIDEQRLVVDTGAGHDYVYGSPGDDVIEGGPGNDKLNGGGKGSDKLSGGDGEDLLVDHSPERGVISGGDGTDRIDARDPSGRTKARGDRISCGAGEDIVLADPNDRVDPDCEHVYRSLAQAPHNLDDALDQRRNWPE